MTNFEEYLTHTIEVAVKKAVKEATKDLDEKIRQATMPEYLTTDGLMEMTGWSRRTCQYMRDTRQITFIQHGRKILYPTADLYEFFDSHKIEQRNRD
ncbi:helix-turn-helix domain-containing protein [Gracilimonas sediminicola]|uniref:helix-turn-helix domain-containing protein n=1 Tax=Gracilimonas sediminicola TaxID=2952158 RepID=UPI0038D45EE7